LGQWRPVIAAARLNEDIVPEREALIKIVKEGIQEYLKSLFLNQGTFK
jgi:hypothetical protein